MNERVIFDNIGYFFTGSLTGSNNKQRKNVLNNCVFDSSYQSDKKYVQHCKINSNN